MAAPPVDPAAFAHVEGLPEHRRVLGATSGNWRTREWYEALDAAGLARRGPYHLRHTFASEALAAAVSIFELSRLMATSVREIDCTYGHLVRDSEDAIRARLEARADRSGVFLASGESGSENV